MQRLRYPDLRRALLEVSKKVDKERRYTGNHQLSDANGAAFKLFNNRRPIFRQTEPGGLPRNITILSLWRTNRLLRFNGINWPTMDWEALLEWLYEHWDEVLRVLLSILALVLI